MTRRVIVTVADDFVTLRLSARITTRTFAGADGQVLRLTKGETAAIREELADRLMRAASGLPYTNFPLNRVKVQ